MKVLQKILLVFAFLAMPAIAQAGIFELGGTFSYQKSTYNAGSFTWTRTWTGSLGYYLTEESEIEFSYSDSISQNYVKSAQDITYHDRTYSMNMILHFFDEKSHFKPYIRGGVGQLNRDATGSYQGGASPPGRLDQLTVIGGIGLKIRITSHLGLKAELTSYMTGGSITTWKDNMSANVGGSIYF
jgi:Outer membrane protein beta-barrel domain